MRHLLRLEVLDQRGGLRDPAGLGVDHHHRRVGGDQRELRLLEEIDEAGRVDQGQVDRAARSVRETDADRLQVADRLGLAVGGGGPVADGAAARDRPAMREQRFDQRRLARVVRADDGDFLRRAMSSIG